MEPSGDVPTGVRKPADQTARLAHTRSANHTEMAMRLAERLGVSPGGAMEAGEAGGGEGLVQVCGVGLKGGDSGNEGNWA